MRVLSFSHGGKASYGLHNDSGIIDARSRLSYDDLRAVLAAGALDEVRALSNEEPDFAENEIVYLAVIPNAPRIFCVGINYFEHMQEGGREPPEKPWIFVRNNESLTGHSQPLLKPAESDTYDWEVELCAIVGKAGRRVSATDALGHIAGYSVFNDGSIREFQRHSPLWIPGKNFHRSGAVGPWMIPANDFDTSFDVRMQSRLNGEVMQDDIVKRWHFSLQDIIEYLSIWVELLPGDMIAMGTPSGVGFARKPPVYLQVGDSLEMQIDGIGTLRNTVVSDS